MKISLAQNSSFDPGATADSVGLFVDADTLETLTAAVESAREWASSAFVKGDSQLPS